MIRADEIFKQAAQTEQIIVTGFGMQRRLLIALRTEPAQQMGVAAEFRELLYLRKGRAEIVEKATASGAITLNGGGTQSQGQSLDLGFQDGCESGRRWAHRLAGVRRLRFSMAR